jgi:type III pantothenate kinase
VRRPRLAADALLLDVGNSKTLVVLYRSGRERARLRLDGAARRGARGRRALAALLEVFRPPRRIAVRVASVAPPAAAPLVAVLRARGFAPHLVSARDPWPFRIAVRNPETIGADRLANVAGLRALGLGSGVAIDAGTAITIDVLQGGVFRGGLIAPGPSLALGALHARTAKLPLLGDAGRPSRVGLDTRSAMRAGVVHLAAEGLAAVARKLELELGPGARVVVTGGAAPDLVPAFPRRTWFEPDLQLLGLRYPTWNRQARIPASRRQIIKIK